MVSETIKKLSRTMIEVGISKNTALAIVSRLRTKEQQERMIKYLIKYRDIMTDHQALQHMLKILGLRN